jgi:hypothetical protein
MSGYGPVHFPLRPGLPSLQTRTGEFTGVSWIAVTDGPFLLWDEGKEYIQLVVP